MPDSHKPQSNLQTAKPSIGVHMRCCNVYVYAKINAQKDAYIAWCPKCANQTKIRISTKPGEGSNSRIFEAG